MFANQYLAYEGLSPGLRATVDTLRAVHKGTELAKEAGLDREAVTAVHPVVRTHPETGKRSLFVNGNYTSHLDGWTEAESAPLLEYLYAEACRPEYTWRHRWQVGDLIIWDNRCTQHAVVADVAERRACAPPRHHRRRYPYLIRRYASRDTRLAAVRSWRAARLARRSPPSVSRGDQ